MRLKTFVWLCLLPLAVVVLAFFLLPMVRLMIVGGSGPQGLAAYAAILTEPRYRATLINTLVLAAATTIVSLVVATIAGLFLQRTRFPGRSVLVAMLTFPLAFPGVVVGFMIILLAGRQGLIGELTLPLFGEKLVFAYSIQGLFLGYLYFSIPRVILTVMAAVEKLDPSLEEAARALGAGPWRVHRDVILPALGPAFVASGAICLRDRDGRVRHRLHARHQYQRAADDDLHRVHALREHRDRRGAVGRARPRHLGGARAGALVRRQHRRGGGLSACAMRDRLIFAGQLALHAAGCAFLIVPVVLSMLAGVTANYFRGISRASRCAGSAGLGRSIADTIGRSFLIALAASRARWCSACPAAYALHGAADALARAHRGNHRAAARGSRARDRAGAARRPTAASADFRALLAVHPRRPRGLHAALHGALGDGDAFRDRREDAGEGAASLGASPWQRFLDVIVPECARPAFSPAR